METENKTLENLKVYRAILEKITLKELKNKEIRDEIFSLRKFVKDLYKVLNQYKN